MNEVTKPWPRSIFVTGGSGFIGQRLIETLSAAGVQTVAAVRSGDAANTVEAAGARAATVELDDVDALAEAMRGADVVFHLAAHMDVYGPYEHFFKVNVLGTRAVLSAARRAGVKRFVFLSAGSVAMNGRDQVGVDESRPRQFPKACAYTATKSLAEADVLAANDRSLETIALRPTMVWGAGEKALAAGLKTASQTGQWAWFGGGDQAWSSTHVDNVCFAALLAMRSGVPGQVYYVLDEEPKSYKEFISRIASALGIRLPDRKIPLFAANTVATLMSYVWRVLGLDGRPPITPSMVWLMGHAFQPQDRRARNELHYRPIVSLDEGLAELAGYPRRKPRLIYQAAQETDLKPAQI